MIKDLYFGSDFGAIGLSDRELSATTSCTISKIDGNVDNRTPQDKLPETRQETALTLIEISRLCILIEHKGGVCIVITKAIL